MKKLFLSAALLLCAFFSTNSFSQQYGIEVNYGLNGVVEPSINNFSHFGAGLTYDIDETYGFKVDFGSDTFRSQTPYFNEKTGVNITRISLQGTLNVSTLINRVKSNDLFNLTAHAGGGYTMIKSSIGTGTDNIANAIMGLTPRFKVAENVFLFVDTSLIFNISQHYQFDGRLTYDGDNANSITGIMYNVSAGIAYKFDAY